MDVEVIEDQLSYLTDDWQIISIVLNSVRNAYLTGKTSSRENMPLETIMDIARESEGDQEQLYSEILKEIKIAFDELGIQVKQLARKIDMLEEEKNKLISKRRSIGRIKSSQVASVNPPSQEPGQLGSSRSSKTRRPIKTSGQSMTSRKGKEKAM
jgi:rubrerythrin